MIALAMVNVNPPLLTLQRELDPGHPITDVQDAVMRLPQRVPGRQVAVRRLLS